MTRKDVEVTARAGMGDVIDALERLSEIEQLETLFVVGTSLGGMINQVFICHDPEGITHLVRANISQPVPQYAKRLQVRLPLMQVVPISILHYVTKRRLAQCGKSAQHKSRLKV